MFLYCRWAGYSNILILTFNHNSRILHLFKVCDSGRAIFVRITGIDKAPIPETDLRLFIVVDDDGREFI